MLKHKNLVLAGAVMTAMPMMAQAASITYSYDLADILVSTSKVATTFAAPSAANGATLTGTAAAPILTIPVGDFVEIGVDATVTGNGGLGLAQYTLGLTDSTPSTAIVFSNPETATTVLGGVTNNISPSTGFQQGAYGGQYDGAGGVDPLFGTSGYNLNANGIAASQATLGVNSAVNLYSTLRITSAGLGTAGTSTTFTPVQYSAGTAFTTLTSGSLGTSSAKYGNRTYLPTDTTSAMPVLTIKIAGSSTTTAPTNTIISLTSSTAGAPTTYGSDVGDLTVTGSTATGYPASSETITGVNKGYAQVTFNVPPTAGAEVYALKLSSATEDANIVADINRSNTGVTASLVSGSTFATVFPGYDILLTGSALNASSYLAFDLSGDTSNAAGITVTGVAAVPEPATMAGLAIGAAGLLLGRRKGRVA